MTRAGVMRTVRLGTAYYPEYLPLERRGGALERDLDLMVDAGIDVIRVGESVWSTWEPRDGEFDVEWMRPVLDAAHERGIGVILGTPTYAVPPWLQRKHPELAVRRADGSAVAWGARQEADVGDPVFRRYAERVIRAVLGAHGAHDALIGVQVDNEPGLHLIHNDGTVRRFVACLREQYGTVDALNEAWGLTYWSHRIAEWDELWHPRGNSTPAYDLVWRRFQADEITEYIGWQARLAREYVPADRFITTCIAYNRPAVDDVGLAGVLDVVSGNAYFEFQDALDARADWEHGQAVWFTTSPAGLFHQADRMRSSGQAPFLVTETGATSIGGSSSNLPPFDGQLEQAAFALIARGARLVSYWHWHTLHSGAETYWGGILGHDREPGRTYQAIADLSRSLRTAGGALDELEPDHDVTVLLSRESRWTMQFQPPLAAGDGRTPDRTSYDRIVSRFVEGAMDAKLQCAVLAVEQLPSAAELRDQHPVLLAPGAIALDDEAAARLEEYVALGGTLVLGIRTGYGDDLARARHETAPGPLRAAAGVRYREYSNLRRSLPLVDHPSAPRPLIGDDSGDGDEARAEAWADLLELEGATPLLGYADPAFARWPAATEHRHGAGRVLYVGTLPDRSTMAALLGDLPSASRAVFPDLPVEVTAHSARNAAGRRVWFLHNWSARETVVSNTAAAVDVLDPARPAAGRHIRLAPWSVCVVEVGRDAAGTAPPGAAPPDEGDTR